MRSDEPFIVAGDRAGDLQISAGGCVKPAVLGRRTLRLLCLASLAVIVYGTLGPLTSRAGQWFVVVKQWSWVPPVTAGDWEDIVTNFVLYVPVGVAFRLLLRRRGRAGWPDFIGGLGLSVGLSYGTELLQQALPGRVSSLTDVYLNGSGALLGCCAATPVQKALRRLHAFVFHEARSPQRLWAILAGGSLLATAVLMTAPWNLVRPRVEFELGEPIDAVHVQRVLTFVAVGFFLAGALLVRARGSARHLAERGPAVAALCGAWLIGVLAAGVLECSQAVLGEHLCSLLHALESALGVSIGCLAAAALVRPGAAAAQAARTAGWLRGAALFAVAAIAIWLAGGGVWRELLEARFSAEPVVNWAPFRAQLHAPIAVFLGDALQQLAAYSLLTALCLFLALDRGRAVALLLVLGVVGTRECIRSVVSGHRGDTTTLLLAFVAWVVTARVWMALQCRQRVLPPAPIGRKAVAR